MWLMFDVFNAKNKRNVYGIIKGIMDIGALDSPCNGASVRNDNTGPVALFCSGNFIRCYTFLNYIIQWVGVNDLDWGYGIIYGYI